MRLTAVLCTRERPTWAAATLRALAAQGPDGLVVVDQSPDAGGGAVRAEAERLGACWIPAPADGLCAARNRGLAAAHGADVVWFVDDDVTLLPGALDAHRRAYADPRVGGAVGRIRERVVRPNPRPVQNRLDLGGRVRVHLDGPTRGPIDTLKGANMSVRRGAAVGAGGFDPALGGTAFLEDAELSLRLTAAGWRLVYLPDAVVVHHSAPVGGCREADPEGWRFHNTGYTLARHRPWSAPVALPTFLGIALKRSVEARAPWELPRLVGRLATGWRAGWRRGPGRATPEEGEGS